MESSSTEVNLWGVPAQPEHRRQDGWTSTPCGTVEVKQDSDPDTNAGERLPNQRPLGEDRPEHVSEEQLVAQVPNQGEESVTFQRQRERVRE